MKMAQDIQEHIGHCFQLDFQLTHNMPLQNFAQPVGMAIVAMMLQHVSDQAKAGH